jgi:hypothetical protein
MGGPHTFHSQREILTAREVPGCERRLSWRSICLVVLRFLASSACQKSTFYALIKQAQSASSTHFHLLVIVSVIDPSSERR